MKKLLLLSIVVLLTGACQQENVGSSSEAEETTKIPVINEEKDEVQQSNVKEEEEEEQIETSTTDNIDQTVDEDNIYEEKTFPEMERIFLKMKDDWFDYWIGFLSPEEMANGKSDEEILQELKSLIESYNELKNDLDRLELGDDSATNKKIEEFEIHIASIIESRMAQVEVYPQFHSGLITFDEFSEQVIELDTSTSYHNSSVLGILTDLGIDIED